MISAAVRRSASCDYGLPYAQGAKLAWRKADPGWAGPARNQLAGAMLALFTALIWPLDALAEGLFALQMAQHIILMGVAAPLVVLGHPMPTMMRA